MDTDKKCYHSKKCENPEEYPNCTLKEECMTMKPKDPSIDSREVRSVEMTDLDKLKLRRAYNCDGCGGHQFSLTGGSFQVRSSPPIPEDACDWTLTSAEGMQISLQFSVCITI